jgi:hypothetical protein
LASSSACGWSRGPIVVEIAEVNPRCEKATRVDIGFLPSIALGNKLLSCLRQNDRMYPFDIYQARAAECQQRAKNAQTEDEKQSWLALADSWLTTAQLRQAEAS